MVTCGRTCGGQPSACVSLWNVDGDARSGNDLAPIPPEALHGQRGAPDMLAGSAPRRGCAHVEQVHLAHHLGSGDELAAAHPPDAGESLVDSQLHLLPAVGREGGAHTARARACEREREWVREGGREGGREGEVGSRGLIWFNPAKSAPAAHTLDAPHQHPGYPNPIRGPLRLRNWLRSPPWYLVR